MMYTVNYQFTKQRSNIYSTWIELVCCFREARDRRHHAEIMTV